MESLKLAAESRLVAVLAVGSQPKAGPTVWQNAAASGQPTQPAHQPTSSLSLHTA